MARDVMRDVAGDVARGVAKDVARDVMGDRLCGSLCGAAHLNRYERWWVEGRVAVVGAGSVAGAGREYAGAGFGELDCAGTAGGWAGVQSVLDVGAPCDGYAGVYGAGGDAGQDWGGDEADSDRVGWDYAAALHVAEGGGVLQDAACALSGEG